MKHLNYGVKFPNSKSNVYCVPELELRILIIMQGLQRYAIAVHQDLHTRLACSMINMLQSCCTLG